MVFPVVRYGCEIWTVKKAEHWRIDAFELWCWRRLLRVPWTARRSNQSILKEISPGCSLEGLDAEAETPSNTLATSCDELTHWKRLWCWEGLGARGEGDNRGWDGWMASLTRWMWVWVNSWSWWHTQGGLVCCNSWGHKESDTTEWLNWTEFLVFWGNFILFSTVAAPIYISINTSSVKTVPFPTHPHQHLLFVVFWLCLFCQLWDNIS